MDFIRVIRLISYLFIFILISCDNESINIVKQAPTLNDEYYVYLGNLHNEGLDHVLDDLNRTKGTKLKSHSNKELQSFIIESSIGFIKEKETVNSLLENQIVNIFNKTLDYRAQDNGLSVSTVKSGKTLTKDEIRRKHYRQFGEINDKQLEYIKKIEIVYSKNTSVPQMILSLLELRNEVVGYFTETEAHPILCGIYIAISSLNYWQDNGYKWQLALLDIKEVDASEVNINVLKSAIKGDPIDLQQYAALPDGIYPWPGTVHYAIKVKDHTVSILKAPDGLVFDPTVAIFVREGSSDFSWSSVSRADWEGGISGALGGAVGGSMVGGVGAVPGGTVGFIAGSISSSAAKGIGQLIFD